MAPTGQVHRGNLGLIRKIVPALDEAFKWSYRVR